MSINILLDRQHILATRLTWTRNRDAAAGLPPSPRGSGSLPILDHNQDAPWKCPPWGQAPPAKAVKDQLGFLFLCSTLQDDSEVFRIPCLDHFPLELWVRWGDLSSPPCPKQNAPKESGNEGKACVSVPGPPWTHSCPCVWGFSSRRSRFPLLPAPFTYILFILPWCNSLSHVRRFVIPGTITVHGILQATILEWVAFPFSKESSQARDWTQVFLIAGGFFTSWATWEAFIHSLKTSFFKTP